jgi:hypothetical protein
MNAGPPESPGQIDTPSLPITSSSATSWIALGATRFSAGPGPPNPTSVTAAPGASVLASPASRAGIADAVSVTFWASSQKATSRPFPKPQSGWATQRAMRRGGPSMVRRASVNAVSQWPA